MIKFLKRRDDGLVCFRGMLTWLPISLAFWGLVAVSAAVLRGYGQ